MTAAHGFKPSFGHTEPRRGTECWGKSPFGYFWGSFPKVTRRKGHAFQGLRLKSRLKSCFGLLIRLGSLKHPIG